MQDDQTTKAVDDLIKKVENSGTDQSGPTLADNPAAKAPEQQAASNIDAQDAGKTPVPPVAVSEPTATANSSAASDDTLDPIKKEALQKLEPLVGELDLNPEEKYRALMMIIQATDNKDLVAEAYQAAAKIEDTKAQAQALLSIINEIDYFKNKENISS